jgi:mannose-6-phosphate isomerase
MFVGITNTPRNYAWGSHTAIASLLGTPPSGKPEAELWLGAHAGSPSRIVDPASVGGSADLASWIATSPAAALGSSFASDPLLADDATPRLPFLLKILAAGSPLSLQVHPNLAQAKEGYAEEERRGIPVDAPQRNYKDANHKPELVCALTLFDGLCGFRPAVEAARTIADLEVDSLKPYVDLLRARPEEAALREVLTAVLGGDPAETAVTVTEAAEAAERLGGPHALYASIARYYPGDPGVIAAMLLNHVQLRPGEAMFLDAGVPHAYLGGMGVEIMANSDNVLRCGLTPKHVDVPELLRVVRFEASEPDVLRPGADASGEEVYTTPVDEFRLSRYVLTHDAAPRDLTVQAPQILLCTEGGPSANDFALTPGDSVFVPAGEKAELSGAGTVFRATVVL